MSQFLGNLSLPGDSGGFDPFAADFGELGNFASAVALLQERDVPDLLQQRRSSVLLSYVDTRLGAPEGQLVHQRPSAMHVDMPRASSAQQRQYTGTGGTAAAHLHMLMQMHVRHFAFALHVRVQHGGQTGLILVVRVEQPDVHSGSAYGMCCSKCRSRRTVPQDGHASSAVAGMGSARGSQQGAVPMEGARKSGLDTMSSIGDALKDPHSQR